MMTEHLDRPSGSVPAEKSRAHREANRLLVGAGLILAGAGIPGHAPEMKALAAAIRAVNRAGVLVRPGSVPPGAPERLPPRRRPETGRFRPTAL